VSGVELEQTTTGAMEQPCAGGSAMREFARTVAALAGQTASGSAYLKAAFAEMVRLFRSPYGAVSVRLGPEVIEDAWHTGATDPRFWQGPVGEVLTESLHTGRSQARRFSSRDAQFQIAMVSVLLRDVSGAMVGVLSLVVRLEHESHAGLQRELVEAAAAQVMLGLARVESGGAGAGGDAPTNELSKASGYRSGTELAFALAASLRNRFGCEQAIIGFGRGATVKVIAVSGLDEVNERSAAVRLVRDAMGEAIDRGGPILADGVSEVRYRVHRAWHEQAGGRPVVSVPMPAGGDGTMVVSLRRAGGMPFSSEEVSSITELVLPYAPAFEMLDRATRSVLTHARSSLRAHAAGLIKPGSWGRKAGYAAFLAGSLWFGFGTLPHTVSASAVVTPSVSRSLSAPFEAQLVSVLASPGDEVQAGQVLAVLDTGGLRIERERVAAELAIAGINEDRAIAASLPSEAAQARAERRRAEARLAEIDRRLGLAQIAAPFSGRIAAGDLRQRVGEHLPVGEPMFEIVQDSGWTVEIAMPQRVAGDLREGQAGAFATSARPESQAAVVLERIRPVPEPLGGRTVYVAEASLLETMPWLKPGMEGSARIQLGQRRVWWLATHRVADYLRMNFWL
jgi:hypothetical protein